MTRWTNETAIRRWGSTPRDESERTAMDGDFAKRHLINPVMLRLLSDMSGRRVLDAGCGNGYLSRMLAAQGCLVTAVEPGESLFSFAEARERSHPQGIRFLRHDICDIPDLTDSFEAVVASMVLPVIPDWTAAMRSCVDALVPGGLFVFTANHPCFEQLATSWNHHGACQTDRYAAEYEIPGPNGVDFHRPLSTYLNELIRLGCQITAVEEPVLDPSAGGPTAYVHLPNFLIVAARRT